MRSFVSGSVVVFALSLLGAAAGCSSTDAATGSSGSGGAGSSDAGLPGLPGPPAKSGYIGVQSYASGVPGTFTNSVGAGFYDGPGNYFAKGCKRELVGACSVVLCDLTNGGNQPPPAGAVQSAGTVGIAGTTPVFSLTYDTAKQQYGTAPPVPSNQLLFVGGETITFTAAGADVPAFTATLVAPSPLAVTSPTLSGPSFAIDASKDLVFEWAGSSVGRLTFNVFTSTTSAGTPVASSAVSCGFDSTALQGTMPKGMLAKLTKTGAATTARFGIDNSNTKEQESGGHAIHLALGSTATQADGKTPYAPDQVTVF